MSLKKFNSGKNFNKKFRLGNLNLILVLIFILTLPIISFAAPFGNLASPFSYFQTECPISNQTSNNPFSLQGCLQAVYNLIAVIAVALAFIFVIVGAFEYMLSSTVNLKAAGKEKIKNAVFGLIVIFLSGSVLYWINPQIFNADLLLYRVQNIDIPGFVTVDGQTFVTGKNSFAANAPVTSGQASPPNTGQRIPVQVTRYYVPLESQAQSENSFKADVQMQGTGYCDQGNFLICQGKQGHYINSSFQEISQPLDAEGRGLISGKTVAVPIEWLPSKVVMYVNNQRYGVFCGTDRGGGINGDHIDLYIGVGKDAFRQYAAIAAAAVVVTTYSTYDQTMSNCN